MTLPSPTPRVWLATFVGLVFTIGVLAGVVIERTWLHVPGRGGFVRGVPGGGPGGRGGPDRPGGPEGPGRPGGQGRGRGGPAFGPPPQQYVAELADEVKLTDAQRAAVLTLLEAQEPRLIAMQEEARKLFIAEQTALHDKISALLTPEQATTFRAWVSRRTGRGRGPGQGAGRN
jgi:Spy/CpxP family protein refolding chaperone